MADTIFELTKKWLDRHTNINIIYSDPQIQFYMQYIKYICEGDILGEINDIMSITAACVYMICKYNDISIPNIKIEDISAYYRIDGDTIIYNYRLVSAFVEEFYKKYGCKIIYKGNTSYILSDTSTQKITDRYKKEGHICLLKHKESGMNVLTLERGLEYVIKYSKKVKNRMYIKLKH